MPVVHFEMEYDNPCQGIIHEPTRHTTQLTQNGCHHNNSTS